MIKKIWYKIIMLIVMLITLAVSNNIYAESDKSEIIYYGTKTCSNCKEIVKYFEGINKTNKDILNIVNKDISNKENENEFLKVTNKYKVTTTIPTIIIGDNIYQGTKAIKKAIDRLVEGEEIIKEIETQINKEPEISEIYERKFDKMNLTVILVASLIDGVNPCAIAMLLFFMTLLIALGDKKKVLLAGLTYTLAIFLTYFLIGTGIFKVLNRLSGLNTMLIIIHIITIAICILLLIVDTQDYMALKEGKEEDVKNMLTKNIKHKIHSILRKQSASKYIVFATFFAGIAVALLEFSCTGQVYIPTITFIINQGSKKALMYLLIYNIGFTLPILIITILAYTTNDIMKVSQLLLSNRKNIKLASIIFYIFVVVYFIIRLIKII